jgi:hypothetical protein
LIIANLQGGVTKSELHTNPVNSIHWFIATFEIRRKPGFQEARSDSGFCIRHIIKIVIIKYL